MITYFSKYFKSINQKKYNSFVNELPIHKLTCSCGKSGSLIKHAYYNRKVKTPTRILKLHILRLICKSCGKTHAVFPICIVPYSQILLKDHINIIKAYKTGVSLEPIMLRNQHIDESNIKYILRQYLRYWKEPLVALKIPLDTQTPFKCLKILK